VSSIEEDTHVVQQRSLATGVLDKQFVMRKAQCDCRQGKGVPSGDQYFQKMLGRYNSPRCDGKFHSNMSWDFLPDFGVEQKLPIFLGVLSFSSPKSLNASLHNWESHNLAKRVNFAQTYLQLNNRSESDDAVVKNHATTFPFSHVSGNSSENIHPGLAISRFCRQAEQSPQSHPNGENVLLFLEKDWHLTPPYGSGDALERRFTSANSLMQQGVPYVRLTRKVVSSRFEWTCHAEGVKWDCTTANQQRYTNLPSLIRCDWFLRYLEPFALMQDSIMYSCYERLRSRKYFDWEEAFQDGRIEWTNSQWVVANCQDDMFHHHEVDQ
jgi:hypothetical protein